MNTSLPVRLWSANSLLWVICQLPKPRGLVSIAIGPQIGLRRDGGWQDERAGKFPISGFWALLATGWRPGRPKPVLAQTRPCRGLSRLVQMATKISRLAGKSRHGDEGALTSLGNPYRRVRVSP